jgi:hypothetical protein
MGEGEGNDKYCRASGQSGLAGLDVGENIKKGLSLAAPTF